MHMKFGRVIFTLALLGSAEAALAQSQPPKPTPGDINCSGMVTSEAVPKDTYLISGEESHYRMGYIDGEYVYINKGSGGGAKVGDMFMAIRPIRDYWRWKWFEGQVRLRQAMGQVWTDVAQMRVVVVHPNVSIAQVTFSCTDLHRGDIVRPFEQRPVPTLKNAKFDHFAPVSGKPVGMLATAKDFDTSLVGAGDIAYVNLGNSQGVKVGDYMRIFRYQGWRKEKPYEARRTAYKMYGFGSTPAIYTWKDLPREVIGEGIVLRTTPTSSTLLITFSLREIYLGDHVEIE